MQMMLIILSFNKITLVWFYVSEISLDDDIKVYICDLQT